VMAEDYPDYRFTLVRDYLRLGYPGMAEFLSEKAADKHFTLKPGAVGNVWTQDNIYYVPEGRRLFVVEWHIQSFYDNIEYKLRLDGAVFWHDYMPAGGSSSIFLRVLVTASAGQVLNVYWRNPSGVGSTFILSLGGFELEV